MLSLSLRRPSALRIDTHHRTATEADSTHDPDSSHHRLTQSRIVGHEPAQFARSADALLSLAMHRDAGVRPLRGTVDTGETVTVATRVLVVWVLFSCRVEEVTRTDDGASFRYVTLPGHPEEGEETFTLRLLPNGDVQLDIVANAGPTGALVRALGPIAMALQRRATKRYLDALESLAD
jgi:uncharacterized protein (UPF0548 family)